MRFVIGMWVAAFAIWAQQPAAPTLEVASIKLSADPPGHSGVHTNPRYLRVQNSSLKECVMEAYGLSSFQISGGPDWFESQRFQIDARTDAPATDDQLMAMLRTLMADRFHLVFHREKRPASGYALVLAKGGLKIKPNEASGGSSVHHSRRAFTARNVSMDELASTLSGALRTPVSNATSVEGVFDITLKWAPLDVTGKGDGNAAPDIANLPTLPEALQQQLGLKLEPRKVSMEVFVIDRAEKPAEN